MRKALLSLTLMIGTVLYAPIGHTQQNTPGCPEWDRWFQTWAIGTNVILLTDSLNATYRQQISNAKDAWNATLSSAGVGVGFVDPPASSTNGATVTFELGDVFDENGVRQVAKIMSTTTDANGNLNTVVIRLDPNKKLLNAQGQPVNVLDNPTNILKTVLHELGHTLGLGHHPFNPSQSCGGQTTSSAMNTMCTAEASNMPVVPTTCDKAGARESYFPAPPATPPCIDVGDCFTNTGCCSGLCDTNAFKCVDPGGAFGFGGSGGGTPILINTGNGGIDLTSVDDGVDFDLNRDGKKERLSWTTPDSTTAFLVLDRNGNKTIDSGAELFGGFTNQTPSDEPNGFRALAEYDKLRFGGNENGVIDPGDMVFSDLRLWRDLNHDGVSQPNELKGLVSFHIASIDLTYKLAGRYDHYGNRFRYRAKVTESEPGPVDRWAWDVILVGAKRASQRGLIN